MSDNEEKDTFNDGITYDDVVYQPQPGFVYHVVNEKDGDDVKKTIIYFSSQEGLEKMQAGDPDAKNHVVQIETYKWADLVKGDMDDNGDIAPANTHDKTGDMVVNDSRKGLGLYVLDGEEAVVLMKDGKKTLRASYDMGQELRVEQLDAEGDVKRYWEYNEKGEISLVGVFNKTTGSVEEKYENGMLHGDNAVIVRDASGNKIMITAYNKGQLAFEWTKADLERLENEGRFPTQSVFASSKDNDDANKRRTYPYHH